MVRVSWLIVPVHLSAKLRSVKILYVLDFSLSFLLSLSNLVGSPLASLLTMASPIRAWRELYTMLGHPEPNDSEATRTLIITDFISAHQNLLFDSETYYIRIPLDIHRSVVPVPHFMDVMQRLATMPPPGAMANISVDLLQNTAR